MSSLTRLRLASNKLSGLYFNYIKNSCIYIMNLFSYFLGSISTLIGNLRNLAVLNIDNNLLTG